MPQEQEQQQPMRVKSPARSPSGVPRVSRTHATAAGGAATRPSPPSVRPSETPAATAPLVASAPPKIGAVKLPKGAGRAPTPPSTRPANSVAAPETPKRLPPTRSGPSVAAATTTAAATATATTTAAANSPERAGSGGTVSPTKRPAPTRRRAATIVTIPPPPPPPPPLSQDDTDRPLRAFPAASDPPPRSRHGTPPPPAATLHDPAPTHSRGSPTGITSMFGAPPAARGPGGGHEGHQHTWNNHRELQQGQQPPSGHETPRSPPPSLQTSFSALPAALASGSGATNSGSPTPLTTGGCSAPPPTPKWPMQNAHTTQQLQSPGSLPQPVFAHAPQTQMQPPPPLALSEAPSSQLHQPGTTGESSYAAPPARVSGGAPPPPPPPVAEFPHTPNGEPVARVESTAPLRPVDAAAAGAVATINAAPLRFISVVAAGGTSPAIYKLSLRGDPEAISVAALKGALAHFSGITSERQVLSKDGTILRDEWAGRDFGLEGGAVLYLDVLMPVPEEGDGDRGNKTGVAAQVPGPLAMEQQHEHRGSSSSSSIGRPGAAPNHILDSYVVAPRRSSPQHPPDVSSRLDPRATATGSPPDDGAPSHRGGEKLIELRGLWNGDDKRGELRSRFATLSVGAQLDELFALRDHIHATQALLDDLESIHARQCERQHTAAAAAATTMRTSGRGHRHELESYGRRRSADVAVGSRTARATRIMQQQQRMGTASGDASDFQRGRREQQQQQEEVDEEEEGFRIDTRSGSGSDEDYGTELLVDEPTLHHHRHHHRQQHQQAQQQAQQQMRNSSFRQQRRHAPPNRHAPLEHRPWESHSDAEGDAFFDDSFQESDGASGARRWTQRPSAVIARGSSASPSVSSRRRGDVAAPPVAFATALDSSRYDAMRSPFRVTSH